MPVFEHDSQATCGGERQRKPGARFAASPSRIATLRRAHAFEYGSCSRQASSTASETWRAHGDTHAQWKKSSASSLAGDVQGSAPHARLIAQLVRVALVHRLGREQERLTVGRHGACARSAAAARRSGNSHVRGKPQPFVSSLSAIQPCTRCSAVARATRRRRSGAARRAARCYPRGCKGSTRTAGRTGGGKQAALAAGLSAAVGRVPAPRRLEATPPPCHSTRGAPFRHAAARQRGARRPGRSVAGARPKNKGKLARQARRGARRGAAGAAAGPTSRT